MVVFLILAIIIYPSLCIMVAFIIEKKLRTIPPEETRAHPGK